jgi:D-lactate dehydrogenase
VRIAFYELEEWEREYLAARVPPEDEVSFHEEPLPGEAPSGEAGDDSPVEALSVFIYSQVTASVLARFPRLRLVATRSTGYDHIDLAACGERGVAVSNVPHYGENTVAEHTFGLILALSRQIHKAYLRTSRFDFSLEGLRGFDLKGKVLGVVGAGAIGLHVIRIAKGFGMRVIAHDPRPQHLLAEVLGFEYVSLSELLAAADVITLHAPLLPATHHLIHAGNIGEIKRGAILVNTARGGLVDTAALVQALDEGILSGAALDVFEGEDLVREEAQLLQRGMSPENVTTLLQNYRLLRRENVVVTPHMAFYSVEAQHRILDTTLANLEAFRRGAPQNLVDSGA